MPGLNSTKNLRALPRAELSAEEKADLMDSTRWLSDLAWQDLVEISRYFDVYCLEAGVALVGEGDQETFMAVVASGKVSVRKEDDSGKQKEICLLGKGRTFGEMSLLDRSPRSAAVVSVEALELLVLGEEKFDLLCQELPGLALHLVLKIGRLLSAKLRQTSGKLVDFLEQDPA